jgi:hypothetical protein
MMTDQNNTLTRETAELQLIEHAYCNCNKCFRARNFIAKAKASEPVNYQYPLLGSIHEVCTKLGM